MTIKDREIIADEKKLITDGNGYAERVSVGVADDINRYYEVDESEIVIESEGENGEY